MKLRISFWSTLLIFLAVMCFHGCSSPGAREMMMAHQKIPMDDEHQLLRLHSDDDDEEELAGKGHNNIGGSDSHPHPHKDDPASILVTFTTINDLHPGKTLPVYFPKQDSSSTPVVMSKEEADSIPFSSARLPAILDFFSYPAGSPQAEAVEDTLLACERKPMPGETKLCATSQESMLDFLHYNFLLAAAEAGPPVAATAVSTRYLTGSSHVVLQNYTILGEAKEIVVEGGGKRVICHSMSYPYVVFYCHRPPGENKVFEVSLQGENGDRVDSLSVCHMDTSHWDRDPPAMIAHHGFRHGDPICHFLPAGHFVWFPFPPTTTTLVSTTSLISHPHP